MRSKDLKEVLCGRHLLLGRKAITNLDSMLKSTDITNKGPFVEAMVFLIVMYGYES